MLFFSSCVSLGLRVENYCVVDCLLKVRRQVAKEWLGALLRCQLEYRNRFARLYEDEGFSSEVVSPSSCIRRWKYLKKGDCSGAKVNRNSRIRRSCHKRWMWELQRSVVGVRCSTWSIFVNRRRRCRRVGCLFPEFAVEPDRHGTVVD